MKELKNDGLFEKIRNIQDDLKLFKNLFIEKFRNTPWLTEKESLGLTILTEFEDNMKDLVAYYDLDENDRDLELLRSVNNKFTQEYYQAKLRSTGVEALDILFALQTAYDTTFNKTLGHEAKMLLHRVKYNLNTNAFYQPDLNKVAILAPFLYPELNNNATLNKNYNLFTIIVHEMFHSIIQHKWEEKSVASENGMDCLTGYYN
ncbi:hypothetical protein PENTCL1PPCAC_29062, partial [Pristionchus entomophagus]